MVKLPHACALLYHILHNRGVTVGLMWGVYFVYHKTLYIFKYAVASLAK